MSERSPAELAQDIAMIRKMQSAMFVADEHRKSLRLDGQDCFACYLDVDGFKEKVQSNPKDLYESYKRQRMYIMNSFFTSIAIGGETEVEELIVKNDKLVWPYMFSDSWFFASVDTSVESLRQISAVAAGIMMRCLEIGFPARGGIGSGSLWWDPIDQIMLGPAITAAYAVASRLECFGVGISASLSHRVEDGAFTEPLRVPLTKKPKRFWNSRIQYAPLHFAKLKAKSDVMGVNMGNYYYEMFVGLAEKYSARPNAISKVKRRYEASHDVLKAMLL